MKKTSTPDVKGRNDISGGAAKQAMSSSKSKDSGNTQASALSQSKPYPMWANGASSEPVSEYAGIGVGKPSEDGEGYKHKVSDTGRLLPFSSDQSGNPEGYHKCAPTEQERGEERTYHPGADEMSGPRVTKPGIPGEKD